MSSKCKRLKQTITNHYHDSGSTTNISLEAINPTTIKHHHHHHHHHHIHLREPPLSPLEQLIEDLKTSRVLLINNSNSNRIKTRMSIQHQREDQKKMAGRVESGMIMRRRKPLSIHTNVCNNSKLMAFLTISSILIMFAIILMGATGTAHALNCFTCSSADNPGCDEAFTGRANITDTDCEKQIGRPAKVCRKLVQYIEHKKVVIRSCGYIDEHEEKDRKAMCYKRSGTFALMMESCICYEDNCNHSASLVPNNQILLLLLSGFSIVLIYIFKSEQQQ